jgi:hypothetical protein
MGTSSACSWDPSTSRARVPTRMELRKISVGTYTPPAPESFRPTSSTTKERRPPAAGPAKAMSKRALRLGTGDWIRFRDPRVPIPRLGITKAGLRRTPYLPAIQRCPVSCTSKMAKIPAATGRASTQRPGASNSRKPSKLAPTSRVARKLASIRPAARIWAPLEAR